MCCQWDALWRDAGRLGKRCVGDPGVTPEPLCVTRVGAVACDPPDRPATWVDGLARPGPQTSSPPGQIQAVDIINKLPALPCFWNRFWMRRGRSRGPDSRVISKSSPTGKGAESQARRLDASNLQVLAHPGLVLGWSSLRGSRGRRRLCIYLTAKTGSLSQHERSKQKPQSDCPSQIEAKP